MMQHLLLSLVLCLQDATVARAEKVVTERPDDPAANLTLAIHYAGRAEWDRAVPCFAKVKADLIRAAVEEEGKDDANRFTWVQIGDAWVLAMAKAGPARQACLDRASWWYAKAFPDLDQFGRTTLKDRLAKIYRPAQTKGGAIPSGWGAPVDPSHKIEASAMCVHSGGAAARLIPGPKAKNASMLRSPVVQLPKGKVLEFSAWVFSDGTDAASDAIRFTLLDASGKDISASSAKIPVDMPVWTRVRHRVELPEAPARASLEVVLFSTQGTVFVDDLSIMVDGKEVLMGGGFEGK